MYNLDSHTAKIMMDLRRKDLYYEQLQNSRVQRSRGMRWAGLACQGGRALVQVGSRLVTLGRRLEQRSVAHSSA